MTNGGGLGILCADACAAAGLDVVDAARRGPARPAARRAPRAPVANPVDLIAAATPEDFERAIARDRDERRVDAVIAIYVPPMVTRPGDVAGAIAAGPRRGPDVPVAAVFDGRPAARALAAATLRVPFFRLPENAAQAVGPGGAVRAWRARAPDGGGRRRGRDGPAAAVIAGALARGGGWLGPEERRGAARRLRHRAAAARIGEQPARRRRGRPARSAARSR